MSSSSSTTVTIQSCLDILRRLDPAETEKHLENLTKLLSNDDISDELYQRVDVPLKVLRDTHADDRKFLACDHNRDGDSHRSPWSNVYFPQPLQDDDDGFYPSERLRLLELHANEVFDIYRELYFGKSTTSVSSVYLWDKEPKDNKNGGTNDETAGFCGAFLIQNKVNDGSYWNSIHVVDVGGIERGSRCEYKLTTTILISVTAPSSEGKDVESTTISGSLIRQNVRECNISSSSDSSSSGSSIRSEHIVNIGKFIEDVETEMRKEMDSLYIQKTKNVVDMIRKDAMKPTQGQEHTRVLNEAVLAMAMNRKTKLSGK